eukprot:COSAG05_NODE_364_length_10775_cov_3.222836_13_plen_364_part_00
MAAVGTADPRAAAAEASGGETDSSSAVAATTDVEEAATTEGAAPVAEGAASPAAPPATPGGTAADADAKTATRRGVTGRRCRKLFREKPTEGSSSARSGSSSARSGSSSARSNISAGSAGSGGSGSREGSTARRSKRHGKSASAAAAAAAVEAVSGGERFLAPMSRMTQAERRDRVKQQRDTAALVCQKQYRGWVARQMVAGWLAAARVIQRYHRGKVWRHALALAAAARARRLANEAACVEKQTEIKRQRAGFERFASAGYVSTAIPDEMKREDLLHFAATQIASAGRGLLMRNAVQREHSWSLRKIRAEKNQRKREALLAQERKAYAQEEAARAAQIAAKLKTVRTLIVGRVAPRARRRCC